MKTLTKLEKRQRSRKKRRTAQDLIPVLREKDGIFFCEDGTVSKTFRFEDLNYTILSEQGKEKMLESWSGALNLFEPGATYKLTLVKERQPFEFLQNESLSEALYSYQQEYNDMLQRKIQTQQGRTLHKYLTVSCSQQEGEALFQRVESGMGETFRRMGSDFVPLRTIDRIGMLYPFFHEEEMLPDNVMNALNMKHGICDLLAPDYVEKEPTYLKLGNRYARGLYLPPTHYPTYLNDEILAEICKLPEQLTLSIDYIPVDTMEALKLVEKINLGVETNLAAWQRRQNEAGNFSAVVPYKMEQEREEAIEFHKDLAARDQRMLLVLLTVFHFADSIEQLDQDTAKLKSIAQQNMCKLVTLTFEQVEGLITALPFGPNRLLNRKGGKMRSMITTSAAGMVPFSTKEITHNTGIYYGQNRISKNLILIDRRKLQNGNSFILGVSGAGKSFHVKEEIVSLMLTTNDDILIIDPEREYHSLVKAFGGEVAVLSPTGSTYINALDMNDAYGEGANPVTLKSDFLMSLCEQVNGTSLDGKYKSLIDRCVIETYQSYQENGFCGKPPTLKDFRNVLCKQKESFAQDLALLLELFTEGSFDIFSKQTNVDVHNRLLCYDILELSANLQSIGMTVVLDNILHRISQNRQAKKATWIIIDEIYLMLMYEYTTQFFYKLWKRIRKYGGFCEGITQNVTEVLENQTAKTMLANSEFLVLLNQAPSDQEALAELLALSNEQLRYISNVPAGCGLLKIQKDLVPFKDEFPKKTKLYQLMTTKLEEAL
ncbi:ATP-binding protein [Mogibacterium sp. BX12]|uniref:ATP-binding protein n=1 Tax=Zhenpiania hominis TaxID=2763644 RepID=A0A923SVP6_9FIRM|nr:ATP-binding protein [Zhenpiania hominis]